MENATVKKDMWNKDYCPDKVQSKINKTTFSGTVLGTFFVEKIEIERSSKAYFEAYIK